MEKGEGNDASREESRSLVGSTEGRPKQPSPLYFLVISVEPYVFRSNLTQFLSIPHTIFCWQQYAKTLANLQPRASRSGRRRFILRATTHVPTADAPLCLGTQANGDRAGSTAEPAAARALQWPYQSTSLSGFEPLKVPRPPRARARRPHRPTGRPSGAGVGDQADGEADCGALPHLRSRRVPVGTGTVAGAPRDCQTRSGEPPPPEPATPAAAPRRVSPLANCHWVSPTDRWWRRGRLQRRPRPRRPRAVAARGGAARWRAATPRHAAQRVGLLTRGRAAALMAC